MFRYSLRNTDTNEIKCILEKQEDVINPWADKFEKFGVFQGMRLEPKNFDIIKENIDSEIAAEQAKKVAKQAAKLVAKDAKKALQAVKSADNQNKLQKATEDLAKVVHALVKALDLVDPTEGE